LKRNGFWIFIALPVLVWLLFSCDHEELCETPATVVELPDGCGLGFELSNGKLLWPVADVYYCFPPPNNPQYNSRYVAGQKVLIGYEKDRSYSDCGAAMPVNIRCLEALDIITH